MRHSGQSTTQTGALRVVGEFGDDENARRRASSLTGDFLNRVIRAARRPMRDFLKQPDHRRAHWTVGNATVSHSAGIDDELCAVTVVFDVAGLVAEAREDVGQRDQTDLAALRLRQRLKRSVADPGQRAEVHHALAEPGATDTLSHTTTATKAVHFFETTIERGHVRKLEGPVEGVRRKFFEELFEAGQTDTKSD